ncbi:MAG: Rrf2 family transcriptional regulator [Pseudomonadota bacterium]
MRLSSLADYAVVLMSAAASHCGARAVIAAGSGQNATKSSGRHSARQLAEQTGIPLPTAQKLVSRLAAAELIDSTRGAGGGIRLARPPATITLTQIVEAVDGPIAVTSCLEPGHVECMLESTCSVKPHWAVVNRSIRNALDAVTLADLVRAPGAAPRLVVSEPSSSSPSKMEHLHDR